MKKSLLVLEALLLSTLFGTAQVAPVPSPTNGRPMPQNQFVLLQQANSKRDFPMLVYWGVAGLEWGSQRDEVEKSNQVDRKRIINERDSFITQLTYDQKSGRLIGVVYQADPFPTNEVERVDEFQRIRQFLLITYGQPSHVQVDRLGTRLQNLSALSNEPGSIFLADWKGPETIVIVDLRKDTLQIRFRPSDSSNSDFIRKQLAAARRVLSP